MSVMLEVYSIYVLLCIFWHLGSSAFLLTAVITYVILYTGLFNYVMVLSHIACTFLSTMIYHHYKLLPVFCMIT